MIEQLKFQNIWFDKLRFSDAVRNYYERLNGFNTTNTRPAVDGNKKDSQVKSKVAIEIDRVCDYLKSSLLSGSCVEQTKRYNALVEKNKHLSKQIEEIRTNISKLELQVVALEKSVKNNSESQKQVPQTNAPVKDDDDDDIDLFGSDDDDEAAEALKQKRVQEYAAKKSKKPALVAKSSVVLDVKPWDDETEMDKLEAAVRQINMDGLIWGASKLVPVAFNIKKLQIVCVVEDDKVSIEELTEKIESFDDYVQSVDVAAFNKI